MWEFLGDAGLFVYPLGAFSVLAILLIVERAFALRTGRVVPRSHQKALLEGRLPLLAPRDRSVSAELIRFHERVHPDRKTFTAFARWQVNRLERGLFILDFVVSAAPLVGLLGTVTGLVEVFAEFSRQGGMPEPADFISGISLALTTTILGLAVAIPALVASSYFYRRVDNHASRLGVIAEQLNMRADEEGPREGAASS